MTDKENKTTEQEELDDSPKDGFGRPTVVTKSVLLKLEQAFALGCTDLEACFYAGISKSTLYLYQEKNPDFSERKEELKMKPVLMARQVVMKGINGHEIKDAQGNVTRVVLAPDPKLAMDYLKNKMHREFKQGVETSDNVRFDKAKRKEFLGKWFRQPPAQTQDPSTGEGNTSETQ